MSDPTKRFSSRVDNYVRYRPGYPTSVVDLLVSECGLTPESTVADVGSGTGILSQLFLKNGNRVFGVEPNDEMRGAAESLLNQYSRFVSTNGAAESTTLGAQSVDFVTAGQAFHWFDHKKARAEFLRVLRLDGWVVLLWNERRLDSTPFLRAHEELLLRYGTDYEQVREGHPRTVIASFFAPRPFELQTFDNAQILDFEGYRGWVFSASYTPEPEHPDFEAMGKALLANFEAHSTDGRVTIEYDATVFYGKLT